MSTQTLVFDGSGLDIKRYRKAIDFFRVVASSSPVTMIFYRHDREVSRVENLMAGFAQKFDVQIDGVDIISAAAQNVVIVADVGIDVRYDYFTGNVNVNQGTSVTNAGAAVNVGANATPLIAAGTRKFIHVRNTGANPMVIGGADVTYANGAIVINPGAEWRETDCSCSAWYAVCNAGLGTTANVLIGA